MGKFCFLLGVGLKIMLQFKMVKERTHGARSHFLRKCCGEISAAEKDHAAVVQILCPRVLLLFAGKERKEGGSFFMPCFCRKNTFLLTDDAEELTEKKSTQKLIGDPSQRIKDACGLGNIETVQVFLFSALKELVCQNFLQRKYSFCFRLESLWAQSCSWLDPLTKSAWTTYIWLWHVPHVIMVTMTWSKGQHLPLRFCDFQTAVSNKLDHKSPPPPQKLLWVGVIFFYSFFF